MVRTVVRNISSKVGNQMIMMTAVGPAHASSHQMCDVRFLRHRRKIVVKMLRGVSTKFVTGRNRQGYKLKPQNFGLVEHSS